MATTFTWIYLGNSATAIDPTEGNTVSENAASFVGQTFGSSGNPLYSHVTSATMIDNGGTATALDQDNTLSNDQFTTDIGAGVQTFTFDGTVIYDATITYANGTTATVTAVIAQDTLGNLFLAPDPTSIAIPDTTAFEAFPITSITLNAISGGVTSYSGISTDRIVTGFDDGYVDGTAGSDLINSGYIEPIAGGTDRIDNNDAGLPGMVGNDDYVRAGAGNDTVASGNGNDIVYGGSENDSIFGNTGSDELHGGTEDDAADGGDGTDTVAIDQSGTLEAEGGRIEIKAATARNAVETQRRFKAR